MVVGHVALGLHNKQSRAELYQGTGGQGTVPFKIKQERIRLC